MRAERPPLLALLAALLALCPACDRGATPDAPSTAAPSDAPSASAAPSDAAPLGDRTSESDGPGDARAADHSPPHVIVWLVDTLRADHLSCYGYERPTSPRLDALAAQGVLFEELHTQSNWTQPSMASMLTGRWPDRFSGGFESRLAEEHLTLAEVFAAHGYATAGFTLSVAVGARFGFAQGFERYEELDDHIDERERTKRQGREYDADVLVQRAFTWLDEQRDTSRPFLLYLHSMDPHLPHEQHPGHPRWTRPYDGPLDGTTTTTFTAQDEAWPLSDADRQHMRDLYDGEVAFNDACLGQLIDGLASRELERDTLLVVLSDHGEELWDRTFYGHGHDSLHREMTRVPFVLRWPAGLPAGLRVPGLARGVDVVPTLLELAGLSPLPSADGVSLAAAARGTGSVPDELPAFSLRGRRHDDPRALRTAQSFLFANPRTGEQGLFLLSTDPDERQDLSAERPRVFMRAAGPLSRWMALLKQRADEGPVAEQVALDPETEERLRALGYLR